MRQSRTLTRTFVAWASAGALLTQQFIAPLALAQQVITDPHAPIQFRPNIKTAPTGAPVVNITRPSAGGLSHNKFQRYNIDTKGVILNNSSVSGTSVLGGQISGNPNLSGGISAATILNEVTGSTASSLAGATEVFGTRANVIVANPNGVGCVGCSFINTGKVTLSTGVPRPNYSTGVVNFDTTRGTITISGTGLKAANGQTISGVDLVGRQLTIHAPVVSGGQAQLAAGAGTFNSATGQFIPLAAGAVTGPAIHSSVAGTIRAGSVSVLSHDLNLGIEMLGAIQALDGKVTLQSAGDIVARGIEAFTTISANAATDLNLGGNVQAGQTTNFIAGRDFLLGSDVGVLALAGITVQAGRNLTSEGLFNTGGDITLVAGGKTTFSTSAILASGNANITTGDFDSTSSAIYAANVLLNATRTAETSKSFFSGQTGDVRLTADNLTLGVETTFFGAGQIVLVATDTLTNAIQLDLANTPNLTVNFGNQLINQSSGTIVDQSFVRTLSTGLVNDGLIYAAGLLDLTLGTLDNQANGVIYSPTVTIAIATAGSNAGEISADLTAALTSTSFVNSGAIAANNSIDLTASTLLDNSGTIASGDTLTLTSASTVNQLAGALNAPLIQVNGASFTNAGNTITSGVVELALTTSLINSGLIKASDGIIAQALNATNTGRIEAPSIWLATPGGTLVNRASIIGSDYIEITGRDLSNLGAIAKQAEIRGDTVVIELTGAITNQTNAVIHGNNQLSISAATTGNASTLLASRTASAGLLSSGGDLFIALSSGSLTLPASLSVPGTFVLSQAGSLTNTGIIQTGGALLLESTSGGITNSGGLLIAGGDLSLLAFGDISNASGTFQSIGGQIYIEGASLTNAGAGQVTSYSATYRNRMIQGRPSWLPQLTSYWDDATYNAHNLGLIFGLSRAAAFFFTNGNNYVIFPQPLEIARILEASGRTAAQWGIDEWQQYAPTSLADFDNTKFVMFVPDPNWSPTYTNAQIVMSVNGQQADVGNLAQIVTLSGDITVKVRNDITNRNGSISSGQELLLQGRNLTNEAKVLYSNITYTLDLQGDPRPTRGNVVRSSAPAPWIGAGDQTYTADGGSTISGQIPATLSAGSALRGDMSGAVTNTGTITGGSVQLTGSSITNTGPDTRRVLSTVLPNAAIDLGNILPISGTAANPGAPATLPPPQAAPDGTQFLQSAGTTTTQQATNSDLSPASILNRVGDIRGDITFLADPVLEQQLIRTALVQETGRQYLDTSFEDQATQQAALYDGTVAFLKQNTNLRLGQKLTDQQRRSVTKPILWYEQRTIQGRKVLVPQLILPENSRTKYVIPPGSISAIDAITLKAGTNIKNSGQLISQGLIRIDAKSFLNERRTINTTERGKAVRKLVDNVPLVDAGQIDITTQDDLVNYGGIITAGERLRLASLHGDIINEAAAEDFTTQFTIKKRGFFKSSSRTTVDVGTRFFPGQVLSGGDVEIIAYNGLVRNTGSTIAAADGIRIVAQDLVAQDVKASTFTNNGRVKCGWFGCNGRRTQQTITQRAIMVAGSGDITVEVTDGDFVSRGSDVLAWQGAVTLQANNVRFETAAFEEFNTLWKSGWSGLTYTSLKNTANAWTVEVPRVYANSIDIRAAGDVTGTAAQVEAAQDLSIQAGGDINFDRLQLAYFNETKGWSLGISFPGSTMVDAVLKGEGAGSVLNAYMDSVPLLAAVNGLKNSKSTGQRMGALVRLGMASYDAVGRMAEASRTLGLNGGGSGAANALLDQFNPFRNLSFGINFSKFKSREDWTKSLTSALVAGRNMSLVAGASIGLLGGTEAIAGGDIALKASRDITVAAAEDRYAQSSKSTSFGITLTPSGFGGASFSRSRSNADGTTYRGGTVAAGGNVSLNAGRDVTVDGGTIEGERTTVTAGRNLTVTSKQDQHRSQSSSFGVSIGASGAPSGVSVARQKAGSRWTNTLATIRGRSGVNVNVGGTTTLTGGAIVSNTGNVNLTTGNLISRNLRDYEHSSGFSFSITGLDKLTGPSAPKTGKYVSPFLGEIEVGYTRKFKEGITYTIVGEGKIELTDPDADQTVLATLKRDEAGRQVVTVNSESGFEIVIPLVDFERLAFESGRIGDFIKSLTTPVPDNVAGMGPQAENLFRRMIASGVNPNDAIALSQTPAFIRHAQKLQTFADAEAEGRELDAIDLALLAQGEILLYGDKSQSGQPSIKVPCTTASTCELALDKFKALLSDKAKSELLQSALAGSTEDMLTLLSATPDGSEAGLTVRAWYMTMLRCSFEEPHIFQQFVTSPAGQDLFHKVGGALGYDPSALSALAQAASADKTFSDTIHAVWKTGFSHSSRIAAGAVYNLASIEAGVLDGVALADKLKTAEGRAEVAGNLKAAAAAIKAGIYGAIDDPSGTWAKVHAWLTSTADRISKGEASDVVTIIPDLIGSIPKELGVTLLGVAARRADPGDFYDPQAWRKNYDAFYGDDVTSTTVPPYSMPNAKLANDEVKLGNGTRVVFDSRGFPIFDQFQAFDTVVDASASYRKQMRLASKDLWAAYLRGEVPRSKFSSQQWAAIEAGNAKIPGFTWHHHQSAGRMQLVRSNVHQAVGHVGRAIQGGR